MPSCKSTWSFLCFLFQSSFFHCLRYIYTFVSSKVFREEGRYWGRCRKESCVTFMVSFYFLFTFISCTLFILCVFVREIKYGNGRWLGTRWGDCSSFWFNLPVKYSLWWKFIFLIYDTEIINYVLRKWCLGSIY